MPNVLIIGYGDTLRGDDGIGVYAAEALAGDYRDDPDVRVIASHQLTPEVSDDLAKSDFALFLDAAVGGLPGQILKAPLSIQEHSGGFTHHCTPAWLLQTARELYGRAPMAIGLTLTAGTFDIGTAVSPEISKAMPEFLRAARGIVSSWQHDPVSAQLPCPAAGDCLDSQSPSN